jgi:hypothetical protein
MAALFVLLQVVPAAAYDVDSPEENTEDQTLKNQVGVHLGIFSAVGFAGFSYTRAFSEIFELEVGFGSGVSGTQLSFMPKLRTGSQGFNYVFGAGLSVGIPLESPSEKTQESFVFRSTSIWLNLDILGFEYHLSSGLALGVALGITAALGGGERTNGCPLGHSDDEFCDWESIQGVFGPQARLIIANWF